MRAPVPASSWLKRTSFGDTAPTSFTGTLPSPKLIAPLQMGRGAAVGAHSDHRLTVQPALALRPMARVSPSPASLVEALGTNSLMPAHVADRESGVAVSRLRRRCLPVMRRQVESIELRPTLPVG